MCCTCVSFVSSVKPSILRVLVIGSGVLFSYVEVYGVVVLCCVGNEKFGCCFGGVE